MKSINIYKAVLITVLAFLIVEISFDVKAQKNNTKSLYAVVDIIIQDDAMLKDGVIRFEMSHNGVNTNASLQNELYDYKVNKRNTRLIIPLSTKINYGRINYAFTGQIEYQPLDHANSLYIFENRDSIRILINKNSISFSGKNSDKYKCLSLIYTHDINEEPAKVQRLFHEKKYEAMFEAQKHQVDSLFTVQNTILLKYKKKLNPDIYNLISIDCRASISEKLLGILGAKTISDGKRMVYDEAIERVYHKWFLNNNYEIYDSHTLAQSYGFCDFLYAKEVFKARFFISDKSGFYNNNYTFEELYEPIQEEYRGLVRDKVNLTAFYIELTCKSDAKSYLDSAIYNAGENEFKKELLRLSKSFSGVAFPFELPDKDGRIVRLSDFKGKLIVLDFWFTGCGACANLAEEMKPIIKDYKKNNVVFISISIDLAKKGWLKSVNEEKYSDKDEVNLYTSGLGDRHPVIKYYNIQGYPTLILISKEGKVISTSLPMPRRSNPETKILFKKLLDSNL